MESAPSPDTNLEQEYLKNLRIALGSVWHVRASIAFDIPLPPEHEVVLHHFLYDVSWEDIFANSKKKTRIAEATLHQKITQALYETLLAHPTERIKFKEFCETNFSHKFPDNHAVSLAASWVILFLVIFQKINYKRLPSKETERAWFNPSRLVKKHDYQVWLVTT